MREDILDRLALLVGGITFFMLVGLGSAAIATPGIEHRMQAVGCEAPPTNCGACHSPVPALNDVGEAWKKGDWSVFECGPIDADAVFTANNKTRKDEDKDAAKADVQFRKAWLKGQ